MNDIKYAEEEMKHFSDLIDGMALDEDEKHKLLRYIKMEIVGAYRAGFKCGEIAGAERTKKIVEDVVDQLRS